MLATHTHAKECYIDTIIKSSFYKENAVHSAELFADVKKKV